MSYCVVGSSWFEKTDASLTVNIPLPAGTVSGDLAFSGWTNNSNSSPASQTGYTNVSAFTSTGSTLAPAIWTGRRTLNSTDISNGFSQIAVASSLGTAGMVVLRGYTTTQDFTAVQLDKTATSSNFSFSSQTLGDAQGGVCVIYMVGQNTVAAGTFTEPSATNPVWTEVGDRVSGRNATMGYRIFPADASTGTVLAVSSQTTRGVGILAAFRPSHTHDGDAFRFLAGWAT